MRRNTAVVVEVGEADIQVEEAGAWGVAAEPGVGVVAAQPVAVATHPVEEQAGAAAQPVEQEREAEEAAQALHAGQE